MTVYTPEIEKWLKDAFQAGSSIQELAEELQVSDRSIIAKLSSMGLYKRKGYVNKLGNPPVKKEQHIEHIAQLLEVDIDLLESLEKVNKRVLVLLITALSK